MLAQYKQVRTVYMARQNARDDGGTTASLISTRISHSRAVETRDTETHSAHSTYTESKGNTNR